MTWLLALSALVAQQQAPDLTTATRLQMDPALGQYSMWKDGHRLDCTFTLAADSPGYVSGGTVTTSHCEQSPLFTTITRWEKNGAGGFRLLALGSVAVGEVVDESKDLEFKSPKSPSRVKVRRVDAPNLRRPTRLAIGWWSVSVGGEVACRFELRSNGTIGDTNVTCPIPYGPYAGGHWAANEGGIKLSAKGRPTLRFAGSGRSFHVGPTVGGVTIAHD